MNDEMVGKLYAMTGMLTADLLAVGHDGRHVDCQLCLDYTEATLLLDECDAFAEKRQ